MGFLQVLLLVRQMESVTTQALAARVSLFAMAHQVGGALLPTGLWGMALLRQVVHAALMPGCTPGWQQRHATPQNRPVLPHCVPSCLLRVHAACSLPLPHCRRLCWTRTCAWCTSRWE